MGRSMLLGARDRPSDTTTDGGSFRWTTTNRSATGMYQADRSPGTNDETHSGGSVLLKLIGAVAIYYYFKSR